jgi:hypothetical protein
LVLNMFLSLLMLLSTGAWAETPKFTILGEGQCAQFEGVLFDKNATGEILSRYDISTAACELQIQHALEKQQARHELETGNLQIRYESLMKENNLFIEQKDKEILQLQQSLKKHSPRNKWMWFVGGAVVGSAATYGAYRTFNEK